jgi:hypothetical protein
VIGIIGLNVNINKLNEKKIKKKLYNFDIDFLNKKNKTLRINIKNK